MKRIKFLVVGCMLFASSSAFAQVDTLISTFSYNKALAVYQKAQQYNDALMTKQALYELLVLNNRDSTVMRSLAELYYNNRQFTSSALVGRDFLEKYPGNLIATELVALSYEQLRLYDKAIEYYQPIWLQTEQIDVLYQISFLQYSLKRYSEATNNLTIVESKVTDEDKVQLAKRDGSIQQVPYKAAVLNLRALISEGEGKMDEAKSMLNQALQIAPDFEAAKDKLAELNKG